jgi:NADP-dependent 3-hydroxy acid dehydrogenase YdfG
VLINNAGIASAGVTEAFTADQAKVVFNTNVVGLLRTSRAVLPAMRKQGDGLIINIGSILGRESGNGWTTSKIGAARELAAPGSERGPAHCRCPTSPITAGRH